MGKKNQFHSYCICVRKSSETKPNLLFYKVIREAGSIIYAFTLFADVSAGKRVKLVLHDKIR